MKQRDRLTPLLARSSNSFRPVPHDSPVPLLAVEEVWAAISATALVTYLKPGTQIWLQLISTFRLASTTMFQIGVAVSPGANWGPNLETFAVELVRVLANPLDPSALPPTRTRIRIFRHREPVRPKMLGNISPIVPDLPCIEVLRIDETMSIDIRGMQNIDFRRWQDEIPLLLKGVALLSANDNLSESQLRYETEVSAAIEKMAQQQRHKPVPSRFTKTEFREHWPFKMSRTNLYNVIPEDRWPSIESRYYLRCEQLRSTTGAEG